MPIPHVKKLAKAFAVGSAFETVVMGIAVVLGFINIPRVYYSPLFFSEDSLMWLRIPLGLTQAPGAFAQNLYHRALHSLHPGDDFEPDPLQLFIIIFVVSAIFWSGITFAYFHWREHRRRIVNAIT